MPQVALFYLGFLFFAAEVYQAPLLFNFQLSTVNPVRWSFSFPFSNFYFLIKALEWLTSRKGSGESPASHALLDPFERDTERAPSLPE